MPTILETLFGSPNIPKIGFPRESAFTKTRRPPRAGSGGAERGEPRLLYEKEYGGERFGLYMYAGTGEKFFEKIPEPMSRPAPPPLPMTAPRGDTIRSAQQPKAQPPMPTMAGFGTQINPQLLQLITSLILRRLL